MNNYWLIDDSGDFNNANKNKVNDGDGNSAEFFMHKISSNKFQGVQFFNNFN